MKLKKIRKKSIFQRTKDKLEEELKKLKLKNTKLQPALNTFIVFGKKCSAKTENLMRFMMFSP